MPSPHQIFILGILPSDAKCEPKPDNDRPKRAEHKTPEKEDRPKDMEIKYGVLQPEDEKILKELLNVDEQFTPLLVLVSCIFNSLTN